MSSTSSFSCPLTQENQLYEAMEAPTMGDNLSLCSTASMGFPYSSPHSSNAGSTITHSKIGSFPLNINVSTNILTPSSLHPLTQDNQCDKLVLSTTLGGKCSLASTVLMAIPYPFPPLKNVANSVTNNEVARIPINVPLPLDNVSSSINSPASLHEIINVDAPSTSSDFELARVLHEAEVKRLNLKPPPPPSGDFELAMDLYLEERALEESDWNIASSCNNPRKKRKQSLITSFF